MSHSTRKFPGNHFYVSEYLGSRKLSCLSRFSFDFLSHSTEKLREEPFNVSKSFKCEVSKRFMNKNGISRFSVGNFLAQSAKRFRCGTLRYMRKVRLSINIMPLRLISLFSVDFFFTYTAYKICWGAPLCFRIFRASKTFMLSRGHRDFPLVFSGLPVLKIFVGNPFNLTGNFGHRNFLCMRTGYHVFLLKFLCLTIPKMFVVTTSKFQMIWDRENFL